MATPKTLLISELNALLRLTQTEATIAHARRSQARSSRIEKELAENAENCDERAMLLAEAIRDLGAIPDVVGSVAGRASALVKTMFEQGQSLSQALLGDLALEHQLLDRTRFVRVLAQEAGEDEIIPVLDRLEEAHTATVDWLMTRLSEVAVGGPPAIVPTPVQTAVGAARRLAQLPAMATVEVLNRSFELADRLQDRTSDVVDTNVERFQVIAGAAADVFVAGRDASLERSERLARQHDATGTAKRLNRTRRAAGAVNASELPIRNYDDRNAADVIDQIEKLKDVDDVRTVLAYEAANKQRKGVLRATEARFEDLAAKLVSVS